MLICMDVMGFYGGTESDQCSMVWPQLHGYCRGIYGVLMLLPPSRCIGPARISKSLF
jgi:hypothetical protein